MKKKIICCSLLVACFSLLISCSRYNVAPLPPQETLLTVNIEDHIESVTLYDGKIKDGKIITTIFTYNSPASQTVSIPTGNDCTILTSKAPTGTLYSSSSTIEKEMIVTVKNDYTIQWANPNN